VIKSYVCPSDPTYPPNGIGYSYAYNFNFAVTNYAGNAGIFGTNSKNVVRHWYWNTTAGYSIANIPDGNSNTVGFTEKYSQLSGDPNYGGTPPGVATHGSYWYHPAINSATDTPAFNYEGNGITLGSGQVYTGQGYGTAGGWNWKYYVSNSNNFIQNQPTLANSLWWQVQAYHAGVLNAAFMDGSVRSISASISPLAWGVSVDPTDGQPVPAF
jgi:prepilin-type processing-associated H-X9-DG protein